MTNNRDSCLLQALGEAARQGASRLAQCSGAQKNAYLQAMAEALRDQAPAIIEANQRDLEALVPAAAGCGAGASLRLSREAIDSLAKTLQLLAGIRDPVGRVETTWIRPNGLKIERLRIPIGVVAVVFDSMPGLAVEAAGVCLKAGNALILHTVGPGKHSLEAMVTVMRDAAIAEGMPAGALQCLDMHGSSVLQALATFDEALDLLIPRGSPGFVEQLVAGASVPFLCQRRGVCHIYVDEEANPEMAMEIIADAKCVDPTSDSAVSVVLLHQAVVRELAGKIVERMCGFQIESRGGNAVCSVVPGLVPASESDWRGGAGPGVLALREVSDLDEAVRWIGCHGTGYSDAIVTQNRNAAGKFCQAVDSACVYVNASTRFTEGAQFGMGGQIGFSSGRLHARGPLGTEELTTYKYVATGTGQVRS